MNPFGLFLSFPAVLLPGMERASIIRTGAEAANALSALAGQTNDGAIAWVSETALRIPAWGGKYAGRESRFALECGKQLEESIHGEITDVVICGNSAAVSQGYSLETSAAADGWHLFNIFGLPYTLESAAAHTLGVALSARGARLALSSGEGSGPAALQFVGSLLTEDPCRTIIWGAAEQFSEGVKAVLSAEGRRARSRCPKEPRLHFEGSILFAVTAARTNSSAFEVVDVRNLRFSDELATMLNPDASSIGESKRIFYVNSATDLAALPGSVAWDEVINLHNQFGDGLSINPFLGFLHMLMRPHYREIAIILSDEHGRLQLLRAVRLLHD